MRVMVVDDSVVFRSQIKASLEGVEGIEVVAVAANGKIALERLEKNECDLIILDLEMPEMNGLETLAELKRRRLPQRVIVFAAPTQEGTRQVFEAFHAGAVDFIAKPNSTGSLEEALEGIKKELVPKILQFAKRRHAKSTEVPPLQATHEPVRPDVASSSVSPYIKITLEAFKPRVIVIGSSTGGPTALEAVFSMFKSAGPVTVPILVAQHMPPNFTECLARRLEVVSGIPAGEGRPGELVKPGRIYVAPGDYHMSVQRTPEGTTSIIKIDQGPKRNSVRPAVDNLFESVAKAYGGTTAAFVFTGMGDDGAAGAKAIKQASGGVMIQNRESSVVWGMPGAVFATGAYDAVGDLTECSRILVQMAT